MEKIFLSVIILLSLSCKNDDQFEKFNCQILKYNSSGRTQQNLYETEFVYKNSLIFERFNNKPSFGQLGLFEISDFPNKDSIVYDKYDRVSKIYKVKLNTEVNFNNKKYSEYIYKNAETRKPFLRKEIHEDSNVIISVNEEEIFYKNDRIDKTIFKYKIEDIEITKTTEYSYDNKGNLTKIHSESKGLTTVFLISEKLFSDYDNYKNPFNALPFINLRGISNSKNNYRKRSRKSTFMNIFNLDLPREFVNSEFNEELILEYNQNDYPNNGIYECE